MRKIIVLVLSTFLFFEISAARAKLAAIFADDMVLQQNSRVAIWGNAVPGESVEVKPSWGEKTYSVKAAADSSWRVRVETPQASYIPYTIEIIAENRIKLNNVLIGEVWLCGGQSNMGLTMKGAPNQGVEGSLQAILTSRNNNLRYFGVKNRSSIKIEHEVQGKWEIASPFTTGSFSATAYYFARLLQKTLDVPVAIVVCCWGGSTIEAWMSPESLAPFAYAKIPKTKEDNKVEMQTPTVLYNGMLRSIAGYGIKGAIWYQGESNLSVYKQYPALFKAMHKDWESRWEIGEFPVYLDQIAPFAYENLNKAPSSALMREAQSFIAKSQPNTGMAVLLDVGDSLCIHPARKQQAGERLAYLALGKTYGMDYLDYQSPSYDSVKVDGEKLMIFFDNAPLGITFFENKRTGFEIAGSDRKFYPATVKFNAHFDKYLTLSSPEVSHPIAARYAWRNYVKATLFGTNGLPVSSFRTDDWEE